MPLKVVKSDLSSGPRGFRLNKKIIVPNSCEKNNNFKRRNRKVEFVDLKIKKGSVYRLKEKERRSLWN